MFSLVFTEWA